MTFLWPEMLWMMLAVPALIGAYVLLVRRKTRSALRYSDLQLIRAAVGAGTRLKRHIPPLFCLLALLAIVGAVARPATVVRLPSAVRTVILAIDVSISMRATDVDPNRLAAAQLAAKRFVENRPADMRIGVVSFAGTAALVQAPTDSRKDLLAAIDRLQAAPYTAIGSGLIVSLAAIFPEEDLDADLLTAAGHSGPARRLGMVKAEAPAAQRKGHIPVPPGSFASAAIVLLTDGRSTMGPDSMDAATMAADRGVRVYAVGFGNPEGGPVDAGGWSVDVHLDEETLKAIAHITRGEYFHATTVEDLATLYESLNGRLVMERKETEITAIFIAVAAALAIASAALSLRWSSHLA